MILNNCRLIGELSDGIDCENGYVEIQDGKITDVGESLSSAGQDVVDCGGMTLLPGLIDLHTHITLMSKVAVDAVGDSMQVLVDAASQAKRFLDHGFTTIRDCGSIDRSAIYVKRMIDNGLFQGPTILACGNTLMPSVSNTTSESAAIVHFCDGVEEYRKGVREETAAGADFIKIYASGSAFLPAGVPRHPIMTGDEIKVAVETARANGLYVAAHCHADSAIRTCLKAGVRTIEHATYLSEETLKEVLYTKKTFLVPTFAAMYVSQTDPKERAFWQARLGPMLQCCVKSIAKAYCEGAIMGFGTDSAPLSPQYEHGVEFQMRSEYCHMNPIDILRQATCINAHIAGIGDHVGTIARGMDADLVLVDGDPSKDISVMYRRPVKTWKHGELAN